MSGRRPFSRLTKDFTAEDWKWVEEKKAELRAEEARRKKSAPATVSANAVQIGARSQYPLPPLRGDLSPCRER